MRMSPATSLEGFPRHKRLGQRPCNPGGVRRCTARGACRTQPRNERGGAERTWAHAEEANRPAAGAIKEIDEFLREHEVAPKPAAPAALPKRDPGDQWVLASAIESRADVLVTGDRDLLDIAVAAPIKIIDPRGFWDLVRKNG